MISAKGLGVVAGLITGVAGITGVAVYSSGLLNSNIEITKLLEEENKYVLLPTNDNTHTTEWGEAWKNYKQDNENKKNGEDKWRLSGWQPALQNMIEDFKSVKGKLDPKYIEIIKYCTRPKTLQEVLKKEGITNLLSTENKNEAWTTKYSQYQNLNNKLPDTAINSFEKLREGCKNASSLKTTDINYLKTYEPFKVWCRE